MGYWDERTFSAVHLSGWDMILEEPALSDANAQLSTSKEPVTMWLLNMPQLALTV